MNMVVPACQPIQVIAFRGDHSRQFASGFHRKLKAEKLGVGPGPSPEECLVYTGHAGVSTDNGATIFGFRADSAGMPAWQVLSNLQSGERFPGIVRDDTAVFAAARRRSLAMVSLELLVPDPVYLYFRSNLDAEQRKSQYYYGFPNGDGDCNCITWLERLGLPLLSGRMSEYLGLSGLAALPIRRFGLCI